MISGREIDETPGAVRSDLRAVDREQCQIEAHVLLGTIWRPVECFIENISTEGAQIRLYDVAALPQRCSLLIPISQNMDEKRECEVLWTTGRIAGVRFLN